jgi:glutamate formiminotransferase/glutamate formiminotransferase/formiminotetrahydrofolate cyclodeaminase
VNLNTEDLSAAKAIAKTVRASSGGLPAVKAIGIELKSRRIVQVSMNLTNVEQTPIHMAYEAVKQEAERHGIRVRTSEIVGLVPQKALQQVAEAYLQLEGFSANQVLETRLEKILSEQRARGTVLPSKSSGAAKDGGGDWEAMFAPFLTALSAGTPTPGGGSVAALAGSLAASLGLMACRVSAAPQRGPATDTAPGRSLSEIEERLGDLRLRLTRLVQADAQAFETVLKAYRIPKEDGSRSQVIAESLRAATEIPLNTASFADEVAVLLLAARDQVKKAVIPDLKVGLFMAVAAVAGGIENARENIKTLQNQPVDDELRRRVDYLSGRLVELRGLC